METPITNDCKNYLKIWLVPEGFRFDVVSRIISPGGTVGLIIVAVTVVGVMLHRHSEATRRRKQSQWRTDLVNHHIYTNVPFPKEAIG